MIPDRKYSENFWNLVKQSSALCKLLTLSHEEVLKSVGDLNCVNGFAKEKFLVIEFHQFVIVAFREEPLPKDNSQPELNQEEVIDFRFTSQRLVEKLNSNQPKPVYHTGHGRAAETAIFSASDNFVSGVITFGALERCCVNGDTKPPFPLEAIYSFQLADDESVKPFLSESFNHRIVLPGRYINPQDLGKIGIYRFVNPINQAIIRRWVPEPLPSLDEILMDLEKSPEGPDIVPLFRHLEGPEVSFKSPLKMVVYFHPGDTEIAKPYIDSVRLLFDGFAKEHDGYLAGSGWGCGGTGFPAVLRVISELPCDNEDGKIESYFNDTLHTLFIVIMDDSLAADQKRMMWLEQASLVIKNNPDHVLIPIGMHDRAFDEAVNYQSLSRIQRTTVTKFGEVAVHSSYAALLVVHEAFKLLERSIPGKKRLTIFLSYAKKDGLPLANAVWSQLSQLPGNLAQNSFYDAISLEPGKPWDEQLRSHAGNCVMLVLRTNLYETRAWCREEFLTAVKEDVPIIVVDARSEEIVASSSDSRRGDAGRETVLPFNRFPITHVRDGNLLRVVGLTLTEGLRQLVFERDVVQIRKADPSVSPMFRLHSGVEGLMEICRKLSEDQPSLKKCRVIYQEPEISEIQQDGYERIIKSFFPLGTLRTCTKMYDEFCSSPMKPNWEKTVVGISISGVAGKLGELETNKLTLHVVERLFSNGGSVVFGHHWQEGGIMQAVYDSMKRSLSSQGTIDEDFRILNMVPWQNGTTDVRGKELVKGLSYVKIESMPLPDLVPKDDRNLVFSHFALEHPNLMRALNAVALSGMRQKLTESCHARICIGGKMQKFLGAMPGILEEAALAIKQNQPLYLCGHWGGVTGAICDILCEKREIFSEEFSPDQDITEQMEELAKSWQLPKPGLEGAFELVSNYSMEQLSKSNGLSKEDNKKLFELSDIRQIMSLVIKGLTHHLLC